MEPKTEEEWNTKDELIGFLLCETACRDFIKKVESGGARSIRSYNQMKDAIRVIDKARGV